MDGSCLGLLVLGPIVALWVAGGGPAHAWLSGDVEGVRVVVEVSTESDVAHACVRCTVGALQGSGLSITPERLVARLVGTGDVAVGDAELDRAAVIRGEPAERVLARLTPEARAATREALAAGGRFGEGTWTVAQPSSRMDEEWICGLVATALRAARALASTPSADALRVRAAEDPVPAVRRRAMDLALAEAPEAWVLRMADHGDPALALRAARVLGEAGRERLLSLVRSDVAEGGEAALALARLPRGEGADEVEERLVRMLRADDPLRAIEALEGFGSVRAVTALQELDAGWPVVGGTPARAREAVRAIQARASGEAGGLSVADGPPGALSEAPGRAGRLSEREGR